LILPATKTHFINEQLPIDILFPRLARHEQWCFARRVYLSLTHTMRVLGPLRSINP
jgi:hypothetical protein